MRENLLTEEYQRQKTGDYPWSQRPLFFEMLFLLILQAKIQKIVKIRLNSRNQNNLQYYTCNLKLSAWKSMSSDS